MALYRLKMSPLLWYKELTTILLKFGLKSVLNINYLYTDRQLIVFFYIDNIIVLSTKEDLPRLAEFEAKLLDRYKIRVLGNLY